MDEEIDWENYETGPFCEHWSDPQDCTEICDRCGHKCCQHQKEYSGALALAGDCGVEGCTCDHFVNQNPEGGIVVR